MDERGRSLWVKVGSLDLDGQGVGRGGRVFVVMTAARDGRGEDEQQRELST
jgi:hypothetical protein